MRPDRPLWRQPSDDRRGAFPATRLTLVRDLTSDEPDVRERATGDIAAAYWKPIYTYLRLSWRLEREDAEDLTQEFFARATTKGWLARYDPSRSRFRSWVRVCLDAFVANERRSQRRLKRGGGARPLPLDFPGAERELSLADARPSMDPEECFRREWMRAFFASVVEALREYANAEGKPIHFALFERYDVADDGPRPTYAALAAAYELPVTQVTNHLAWARREFRRLVLERLRALSGSDEEFRAEARELLGVSVE